MNTNTDTTRAVALLEGLMQATVVDGCGDRCPVCAPGLPAAA